jgi:type IV fimbrial biogenesis protein FimT
MLKPPHRAGRGFTLIELLIVVAIIGLTTALAAPALRTWSANAQTRSAGSTMASALRMAQAEAVKSYQPVAFYRTAQNTCTGLEQPSATGAYWVVRLVPNVALTIPNATTKPAMCGKISEQSDTVTVAGPTAVCFGPNGRPVALTNGAAGTGGTAACGVPNNGQIIYTVDTSMSVASSGLKRLSVWVTMGGGVRLCDRERLQSDSAPDGCPAS